MSNRQSAVVMQGYGIDNHVSSHVSDAKPVVMQQMVKQAIEHLLQLEGWWNAHAARKKLPIKMNVTKVVNRLRGGDIGFFVDYFHRQDDSGVLHETQIITVIDIICTFLREPTDRCGLLLGALQAGKTLTAIAVQWLGPVYYLLTGKKLRLIYLITSHTSHEDQTKFELHRFLGWYGDIEVQRDRKMRTTLVEYLALDLDPMFAQHPTLNTYRNSVLRGNSFGDTLVDHSAFVRRRVHGKQVGLIAEFCGKAHDEGVEPVLILDEMQVGSSDPEFDAATGSRKCVLRQILDAVSDQIAGRSARYIAFSATPFPLYDIAREDDADVWQAKLALSSNYVGFNWFGGEIICDGVEIKTPRYVGFSAFGDEADIDLLSEGQFSFPIWALQHRSLSARDRRSRFNRWAARHKYDNDLETYIVEFETTVQDMIRHCVASETEPVGICVRLCNSNELTKEFIKALAIDPDEIEVLEFFSHFDHGRLISSGSVKRFLHEKRKRLDLPFIVFVTNKARMGDSFPANVKYFIECPEKATTMNALLQGLLGRACGYNKQTTVILSDHNEEVIENWVAARGGHVYPGDRHVIPIRMRRGPRSSMVKITAEMDDPVVAKFWREVDRQVIQPWIKQGASRLSTKRVVGAEFRTAPLLQIAAKLRLFEHLEKPDVRERLFPTMRGGNFRIARAGDEVAGKTKQGEDIVQRYVMDDRGWCAFTFRHSQSTRGGMGGRGKHTTDTGRDSRTDRARIDGRLEPQVNVEKFDPNTGKVIDDRDRKGVKLPRDARRPGNWRPHMITFPLLHPMREIVIGDAQLPNSRSAFDSKLSEDQRADRDDAEGLIAKTKKVKRQS